MKSINKHGLNVTDEALRDAAEGTQWLKSHKGPLNSCSVQVMYYPSTGEVRTYDFADDNSYLIFDPDAECPVTFRTHQPVSAQKIADELFELIEVRKEYLGQD